MKFKYLLVHEDCSVKGTNDEACAKAFGESNCATLVVNLSNMKAMFEGESMEVLEQKFDPADWE